MKQLFFAISACILLLAGCISTEEAVQNMSKEVGLAEPHQKANDSSEDTTPQRIYVENTNDFPDYVFVLYPDEPGRKPLEIKQRNLLPGDIEEYPLSGYTPYAIKLNGPRDRFRLDSWSPTQDSIRITVHPEAHDTGKLISMCIIEISGNGFVLKCSSD